MQKYSLVFSMLLITLWSNAQSTQPVELGKVKWLRSFDQALLQSKEQNKPVFILFQEIPGCATCRNYGQDVLTHPLIVEAIETLFVPLAIHNNKGGADAQVLKFYGEPAWNNPVVRIVSNDKTDIIQRVSGDYSQLGVVQAMLNALKLTKRAAPYYLDLLCEELTAEAQGTETATLSMFCFWTGEGQLGQLDGVVATEPGFMNGREVVQVAFNPNLISFDEVLKAGSRVQCADQVFTNNEQQKAIAAKVLGKNAVASEGNFRLDNERKYYLSKTIFRFVPMTPLQAMRANSLVGNGKSPEVVLSSRQIELAKFIQANPNKKWENVIGQNITEAWAAVESKW